MTKIGIITGSTRDSRINLGVAEWIKSFADKKGLVDVEFEILDIKETGLKKLNGDLPPFAVKECSNEAQNEWSKKVNEMDGFIFVTPEYNKNITSSLKDHLDYLGTEWHHKAAGVVSYGSTLGMSAANALRLTLANLKVAVVEPQGAFSLFNDFENMTTIKSLAVHNERFSEMIDDVIAWSTTLKSVRIEPVTQ